LNRAEQLEKDLISLSFSSPFQLSQQPNELSQKQTRRQKKKKTDLFSNQSNKRETFPPPKLQEVKVEAVFGNFLN